MFKKLNSKLGLTFLIVLALLIVGIAYILYTSDSDDVKSARQNSEGRLVESDDVVVERAGNWTAQEAKSASSGSYLYSSGSPDDVLTLTFVGSRVEVIYTTGTNLGTLAVDVDHTVLRTIITADQATQYQERTVVDYLDDGLHTLRVYAQEGGVVGIDAFRVSRASQEAMIVDLSKVKSETIVTAQAEGQACVSVALVEPEPLAQRTPGRLADPELIKQRQDTVLGDITKGNFEVTDRFTVVAGFNGYADLDALLELQTMPLVIAIDLCGQGEYGLDTSVPRIQANIVRNVYNITGRGMVVAVLDSGVDVDHPDLSDSIIGQYCSHVSMPPGCPSAPDVANDIGGHGTRIAGIITSNGVSRNGSNSLIGVAPNAGILAIRLENNAGYFDNRDVERAINYILGTPTNPNPFGVDAINMSFSLPTTPAHFANNCNGTSYTNLENLITQAFNLGIRVFSISHNQGDLNGITFPGCLGEVIAIGATDDNDIVANFSNTAPALDFLAPGVDIVTTDINGGISQPVSGTSFAAPHAAATGVLIEQTSIPIFTDATFRTNLGYGGVPVTDNRPGIPAPLTRNRVDALNAVLNVLPDSAPGVAPHNDSPSTAHSLPSIGSFAYDYEYIQDPEGSNKTVNDIPLSTECGGNNFTNTVWFRYGPSVSSYWLSLTTKDSTYDTIIAVYEQTISSGNRVACNDDISYTYSTTDHSFTNEQSAVNFQVRPNFTYYIMVAQKGTTQFTGPEGLHLWVSLAPAGDTLAIFYGADQRIRLSSTLRDYPQPVDYSFYPTGNPVNVSNLDRQWVMGDWDGDGDKTPGFYDNAVGMFYTTNIIGTTNNQGRAIWTLTWFGLTQGVPEVGVFAVAGRFDATVNHDCIGVIDSGNFPPYGVAFAMYFTCDFSIVNPQPKPFQWLSVLLPDNTNPELPGLAWQFAAGDFGTEGNPVNNLVPDGIDTIAVRRGHFVAFSNTPPTTVNSGFPYAQYIGFATTGSANAYGRFVVGDWDSSKLDSFGIYYNTTSGSIFYRRNDLQWNSGEAILQTLTIDFPSNHYSAASWRETTPVWPTP